MKSYQLNSSFYRLLCGLVVTSFLAGCADRVQLAENSMAEIRNSPAQPIEPPPQPEIVEDYVYNGTNVRSPFLPQSLMNLQAQIENDEGVTPDTTREKQPLEEYELSQLVYHGMVLAPDGVQYGLVQLPDGLVQSVKVGDYMGVNDGRIVEITSTQINLIEIVPDNRGRFIERPASLVSSP
ncbi:pilus assembly protein PilP [Psychrobacter sp. I-STPA6b]|uniref:pilus assembly protein PilP n=1 Tax=Psychrobacter sp. I-STPA6b TaxID=2585718 RepID=UPI001D0C77B8|nr:pilus assembly protein PilP [Psychrobacter sp. I-STPA6b]